MLLVRYVELIYYLKGKKKDKHILKSGIFFYV